MKGVYPEIRELSGEVLVVSFAAPAMVASYVERTGPPFPVLADPERNAYRALGLGQTNLRTFFRPWVLGRYLWLMVRGWLPRKPNEGENVWQLGGDFVLDRRRRLVYAHPSAVPTDRPPARDLLEAVRAAARQQEPSEKG